MGGREGSAPEKVTPCGVVVGGHTPAAAGAAARGGMEGDVRWRGPSLLNAVPPCCLAGLPLQPPSQLAHRGVTVPGVGGRWCKLGTHIWDNSFPTPTV